MRTALRTALADDLTTLTGVHSLYAVLSVRVPDPTLSHLGAGVVFMKPHSQGSSHVLNV